MHRPQMLLALALVAVVTAIATGSTPARFLTPSGAAAQTPAWQNISPSNPCAVGYGCYVIATDPTHPGWLYLGTEQGVWKSLNQGVSWARVDVPWGTDFCGSRGFDGRVWALSVASNGDVYANNGYGCTQGALRSTDGGVHWTPLVAMNAANGPDINNVDVDPANPAHLIVSYHSGNGGVNESSDFGASWAFHPAPGSASWAFFLTSSTWINTTADAGVWRTTNSGATWTQVSTYNAMHGHAQLYKAPDGDLYLTADRAILRSADQGATWAVVLANSAPDGFEAVIGDGTYLYTRTANTGNANGGPLPFRRALESNPAIWSDFAQPLANGPMSLAADSQYVYSSNWSAGVWRLPISAPTATPTSTILSTATPSVVNTATPTPMAATSTPTPVATATSTSTPTPTATPPACPVQPTPYPEPGTTGICKMDIYYCGVALKLDLLDAFCGGAHP